MARKFERYVTKFAPHKALMLIARGKLTSDERVVLRRVDRQHTKHRKGVRRTEHDHMKRETTGYEPFEQHHRKIRLGAPRFNGIRD